MHNMLLNLNLGKLSKFDSPTEDVLYLSPGMIYPVPNAFT